MLKRNPVTFSLTVDLFTVTMRVTEYSLDFVLTKKWQDETFKWNVQPLGGKGYTEPRIKEDLETLNKTLDEGLAWKLFKKTFLNSDIMAKHLRKFVEEHL